MKIVRAIISGAIVWVLVITMFTILDLIPVIKDSNVQQAVIMAVLIIPFAALGSMFYYKKNYNTNAIIVGLIMISTALLLDVIITVPFFIIPNNGSYQGFFTDPILWLLVVENMMAVYIYWNSNIKPKRVAVQ